MTLNPATLWAETLIDELRRAGLRRVCIAPGSRSTPLTLACLAHPDMHHSIHLDERSAAFFALGLALGSGEPTALICTSGTAAAEFFPAIIEASQSEVPLLVLTADRPPELRHSGANQTIDQLKLYGSYVRWSVDAPLPEANPSPRMLRSLRALADRAVAAAKGLSGAPGPVHINLPFRKPLEPDKTLTFAAARPVHTRISSAPRRPHLDEVAAGLPRLQNAKRGLIVAGPRLPVSGVQALGKLSAHTGWPILADALSGLRFGAHLERCPVVGGYTLALAAGLLDDAPLPEVVLRFGQMPVSQPLADYLEALPASVPQIGVDAHGVWHDPTFRLSHFIAADPTSFANAVQAQLIDSVPDIDWAQRWQDADSRVRNALHAAPPYIGTQIAAALNDLPAETQVFAANSLPVRHVDECLLPRREALTVFANRGASGIDGTLSTGLGLSASRSRPTVIVCGDLSFYHDQNGLLALRESGVRANILLINNNGGGIFQRLPIARHEPAFSEAFVTPHGLGFAHTAAQYGLDYTLIPAEEAASRLQAVVRADTNQLIEVRTDAAQNEAVRQQILKTLKKETA